MARSADTPPAGSDEFHRSLFNEMLEGFALLELVCDDDGVPTDSRFLQVNSAFEELTGVRGTDVIGHRVSEAMPATSPQWLDRSARVALTGESEQFRVQAPTLGKTLDARVYSPERGRLAVLFLDATERRQATDEALRESESRYRGLFENMDEGLAYCQMIYENGEAVDWIYLEVNRAFEKQTGLANAAGKRVSEVIPGIREADPELFARYSRVALTGEPTRFEMFVESLDMWFDLRVFSPQKGCFVAVFDVITERKNAEVEAKQREERLQALLDNAPYGAHMYTLTSDDRLVFSGFNARAVKILGIDHTPLVGKTLEEAFPGNVGTDTPERYRQVAREGGTWETQEYAYNDDNGIAGIFEVFAFSFGPQQVSVFFRDVTELRRTELELQLSDAELRETIFALARANRTLKALSECNESLVRAQSEQELLKDICSIAVERGGYLMTWVGFAEDDAEKTVRPVAFAGAEDGYLSKTRMTWDENSSGCITSALAIRTRQPVTVNSVETDPRLASCREPALARGFKSIASFPLVMADESGVGCITFMGGESSAFEPEELGLLAELASDLAYGVDTLRAREKAARTSAELSHTNDRLEGLLHQITTALGRVVEARDPYTSGHEERVAALAGQIARELGLPPEEIEAVEIAALVHDVGKLKIPAEILTKPSALDAFEIPLIQGHSQSGYDILKDIDFEWPIADIVLQHHERMDGSGYPNGLVGDDIMLAARVLAVADVVEAMASHRPYRAALGLDAAIAEISGHPELFDEQVVAACLRLYEAGKLSLS